VLIGMGIVNRKTAQIVEKWAILKRAVRIGARRSDAAACDLFGHRAVGGSLDKAAQLVKRQGATDQVSLGNIATGVLQEP